MFAKHGAVSRQRSGTPPFGLITAQGRARALLPCAHMLFLIACVCSLGLLPSVRSFTYNAAACGPQDYMRVPPLRGSDCLLVANHSAHLSTLGTASPVSILRVTHWMGEIIKTKQKHVTTSDVKHLDCINLSKNTVLNSVRRGPPAPSPSLLVFVPQGTRSWPSSCWRSGDSEACTSGGAPRLGVGAALWHLAACSFASSAVRSKAARKGMHRQGGYKWGCLQSPWRKCSV